MIAQEYNLLRAQGLTMDGFSMVDRLRSKTVMLYDSNIEFVRNFALNNKCSWSAALRKVMELYQLQVDDNVSVVVKP
jgi:hypothetical protein